MCSKLLSILFTFILSGLTLLHAQSSGATNPQMNVVTIPTPTAASFAKFGDYPVSLYSGLVDISIPVYEIKSGSLSLPISIKYHPSGIKVNELASWVGLGWTLDAGGMISRKVNGNVDELANGYLASGNVVKSTINFRTNQDDLNYLLNFQKGFIDGEPDVFAYNFPGKSGHFIFNRDKTSLIKLPLDKTRITTNLSGNLISIVDENGLTYQFGKGLDGSNAYETSTSFNPMQQVSAQVTTSWLLTAMISADKADTISFKYSSQYLQGVSDINDYGVLKDNLIGGSPNTFQSSRVAAVNSYTVTAYATEYKISEIDFRNGKIVFNSSVNNRLDRVNDHSLQGITVYRYNYNNNTYSPLKSVQLYQSYYSNNDRLRLDSLQMQDSLNTSVQSYSFGYNATLLPGNLSRQKDWWGYYNNNNGSTLIPLTQVSFTNDGGISSLDTVGDANREPDTARMKAGVLERITYPTGGHTEFTYETNQYFNNNAIVYAGGLRIKQIRSYDGLTLTPLITTYRYGQNESGYGNLNAPVNFSINPSFFSSSIVSQDWGVPGNQNICPYSIRSRTYSSALNIDLVPYDGTPVYYDYVTEYKGDPSTGATLGKTVYNYLFTPDVNNAYVPNSMSKLYTQTNYWKRGYLASKSIYNANNALVYQLSNNYGSFQSLQYDSVGLFVNRNYDYVGAPYATESLSDPNVTGASFNCGYPMYLFDFASYSVTTGNYVLNSTTETTYDQNNSANALTKTTNYSYSMNNFLPSQITTDVSTGEKEVTFIKYPLDYAVSSTPDNKSLGLFNLQTKNIITVAIEKSLQRMNVDGTNARTLSSVLTTYKPNFPYPDTLFRLETASGLTDFTGSGISGNNFIHDSRYQPSVILQNYDSRGNTLQQQKISDRIYSYIWDYNQEYPIAEAVNANFTDMAYTSFEADGTGNWILSATASVDDPASPTGNKCYNLTATNYLSRSGLNASLSYVVSYWSKNGSSPVTVGGTSGVAGATLNGWTYYEHVVSGSTAVSVNTGGTGFIDEVRLYPRGALMTTYSYAPLIGMTTQCDPSNRIHYYEYDAFNRMKLVRDINRNILKKYDYFYQAPNNTNPLWQTISASCDLNASNQNTGYQTLVQVDKNPNSASYLQQQSVSVYNTTACPVTANVTYSNSTTDYIYLSMTNTSTSTVYNFTLNPGSPNGTVAGQVPIGNYNVSMSSSNGSSLYNYGFYTYSSSGVNTASFYNVSVCVTCAVATVSY